MQTNKINLKGMTKKTAAGILVLLLALVNAALQIFDLNIIPVQSEELANIISTFFLTAMTLRSTWKNCNLTTISQKVQQIADAIRCGELPEEVIEELIAKKGSDKKEELI